MSPLRIRLHQNILWLILDRPPLNNLTAQMLEQLTVALRKAIQNPPSLVVLSATGERAFCAGVDLPDDSEAQRAKLLLAARDTSAAFEELRNHAIPTVALIRGSAFGAGCELVALCDTVIAHEDAQFRLPAGNAKIFPDAVSVLLSASIGQETTLRLMQSGETLAAKEAMHLGLAHQVLRPSRFLLDAEELLVMLSTKR
jgi:enoyl-CoA hydratase/carnithine racemase